MKHHKHSIGWRRANRMDVPVWKDLLALATCYIVVIGLTVVIVHVLCE